MRTPGRTAIRTAIALWMSMVIVCAAEEGNAAIMLERLVNFAARDEIGSAEILRIPDEMRFISQIGPPELEAQWIYRFSDRRIGSDRSTQLSQIVKGTKIQKSERTCDLRWGIILYSRSGDRIAAIYFDKTGRYGSIGGVPVVYPPELFTRLKRALQTSIQ